ncbi:MAG: nitroreductase family deazaflavin-dependent oxidoreductase [Ilumatobacteraceae bacterium]
MTENTTGTNATNDDGTSRYLKPGWGTRRVMNPVMAGLVRLGFSVKGARELQVRGRTSGEWRTTPVNLLVLDGHHYLVSPRGHTQWVRNVRVAGGGRLRTGRRTQEFLATEIPDADKAPVVRAYLEQWAWEVGQFFDGIDASSSDETLTAAAPGFPVFRVSLT